MGYRVFRPTGEDFGVRFSDRITGREKDSSRFIRLSCQKEGQRDGEKHRIFFLWGGLNPCKCNGLLI
jgi:hypothetical protein